MIDNPASSVDAMSDQDAFQAIETLERTIARLESDESDIAAVAVVIVRTDGGEEVLTGDMYLVDLEIPSRFREVEVPNA